MSYNNNQRRGNQPRMPGEEYYGDQGYQQGNPSFPVPNQNNQQNYNQGKPSFPTPHNQQNYNQGNPSFPTPKPNNQYQNPNQGYSSNNRNEYENSNSGYPGNKHYQNQNQQGQNYNQQGQNYNQNQQQNYNQQGKNYNQNQQQNYNQQGQNYNQNQQNSNYNSSNINGNESPFNFRARDHMFVGEVNGQQLHLSDCKGNKKALLIGINYFGTKAELRGCINDVNNIANLLLPRFNFNKNNVTLLTDDQKDPMRIPNYDNIIGAMKWLVEGAKPGDSLFLHYSGHGGSEKDQDGDEEDGFDETILPLDYEQKGQISDDLLFDVLIRNLPQGVRLTAIFDSCHSGSVLDLPFTYKNDGTIAVTANSDAGKELAMSLLKAGLSFSQGNQAAALSSVLEGFRGFLQGGRKSQAQLNTEKKKVVADVIQFAGCRDDQTSADAVISSKATGAMSYALCETLKKDPDQTYLELLNNLRSILTGKYTQVPQISTGYAMDLNNPFFM